ncbi:hypothetical protein EII20_11590 [Comamonadaceae bacterium OH2545_COT-014]|nr:hypothetical protein EII20_11590 [Comamonadaceae bacterium OH2545_COT-014]
MPAGISGPRGKPSRTASHSLTCATATPLTCDGPAWRLALARTPPLAATEIAAAFGKNAITQNRQKNCRQMKPQVEKGHFSDA